MVTPLLEPRERRRTQRLEERTSCIPGNDVTGGKGGNRMGDAFLSIACGTGLIPFAKVTLPSGHHDET